MRPSHCACLLPLHRHLLIVDSGWDLIKVVSMATCCVIAMTSCGLGHHDCDARRSDSPGLHTHKLFIDTDMHSPPHPHPFVPSSLARRVRVQHPSAAGPDGCLPGLGYLSPPLLQIECFHVVFHVVSMFYVVSCFLCPHTVLPLGA